MIQATSLQPPFQTAFSAGDFSSVADVPIAKGGAGQGFGPHELLEAALATCMVITARKYAQEHDVPLTSVYCEVRIDRSAIDAVTMDYVLSLEGQFTPLQDRELRNAVARCPVAQTLTGPILLRSAS